MRVYYASHAVPLPEGHRFPFAKYRLLRDRLLAEGLLRADELHDPPAATREELLRAHDAAYLDAALAYRLDAAAERRIGLPVGPALVARELCTVGATLTAARDALALGFAGHLGGGTHHAMRAAGEGYCLFNDVAVAALTLLESGEARRVLVVDLDVHQGNGNAEVLAGHPQVHILCMHGARNFPWRKVPSTQDVPLEDGTGDDRYLALLDEALPQALRFVPDLVFYIAGVDPLVHDSLGRLKLSFEGLRERDRRVLAACRDQGAPVALTMGGGYSRPIEHTVAAHANTYRAAREVFGPT